MKKSLEQTTPKSLIRQNSGQIIVEYILLMFIAVTIATLLTSQLVGRSDGNNGVIISKWVELLDMIGQDVGD